MTQPGASGNGDSIPDFVAARDHALNELVRFVRALRRAGVNVPANASQTAARALVEVGFEERERVKIALRASLLTDREDYRTFADLFGEFWRRLTAGLDADGPASRPADEPDGGLAPFGAKAATDERDEPSSTEAESEEHDRKKRKGLGAVVGHETATATEDSTTTALYSQTGRRTEIAVPNVPGKKFEQEFDELTRALTELPGRRWHSGGDAVDVRRTLRRSFSTGGTVLDVPRRERARSAVRAVLLVDVSRSVLDVLDRSFLLDFLRHARASWRDARVFFFDEELREVTASFDAPTSRAALDALERAETEWGGGTHIGGSIERLRQEFPETVNRRSVVFVVSDGLEMGDVSALETEMTWLSRRSVAVFWLNPLAAAGEYEPTASGMAAALPYVEGLFAFAGPDDIGEIARQLRRQGTVGRVGYEYDTRREA